MTEETEVEEEFEDQITNFFTSIGVEGLGAGNVRRLISAGFDRVPKILAMSESDFLSVPGFKTKMAEKLHNGIQDNPLSSHTEYSIPDELKDKFEKMCEEAGVKFDLDKKLITPDLQGFDDLF